MGHIPALLFYSVEMIKKPDKQTLNKYIKHYSDVKSR